KDQRYILAVFRSRQHTLQYEAVLKRMGIQSEVISTPKETSVGCGLSLKIDIRDLRRITELWQYNRPDPLVGVYIVEHGMGKKILRNVRVFSL
ncbi:MAG TPA: DUF3343 domain-containing protein, partial [Clostridia bacterium]|nr:DUF3343 domain-containing protein [Clostridia bacterium]